jgi:hypothetical protein
MVFTTLLLDIWVLAGKNYSGLKNPPSGAECTGVSAKNGVYAAQ